jgi:hypothetical protein
MNSLTKKQKRIYDSVKTKNWFTPLELDPGFNNRASQCSRIADKGYFMSAVFFCGNRDVEKFKKVNGPAK